MKKHREKAKNKGKTQGKHREFCLAQSVATLIISKHVWSTNYVHMINEN